MALKSGQRLYFKLFGSFVQNRLKPEKYEENLRKAHIHERPEAFLATQFATSLMVLVGGFFLVAFVYFTIIPLLAAKNPVFAKVGILLFFAPFFFAGITWVLGTSNPQSKAKSRAKDINLKLPYALNYVAAMASAGVIPTEIFQSFSKQKIYGEAAKEAAWIYKDIAIHGKDIVTALRRAIDRSPSVKFQEFLQGAITTITSGGDLKEYFQQKAVRYQWENRQDQKAFIDTMGLMAETYVTVGVAGPLFMMVMMAIIAIIKGSGPEQIAILTYVLLPVINAGYVFMLKSMIPEV
ncbi:MAG: type II secretion system F family protein [Euryarchaeota archaeon]|nr:type II secretion system F family protein [Euryarchaeota archaeon]